MTKNNEALYTACENGHLEIVQLLVDKGADINTGKILPIIASMRGNHMHILHILNK
uniref:Uncharacterized protein n=1 Tax=Moumouvirus sp. 'Monve' TaxID=1128131 RepID=H2ECV8_9VIRU|nr:hypothetical protein mv_L26 [Moumouvirus Monve]